MEKVSVALGPPGRRVRVVEDVSLRVDPGRVLCIVGESGSGKSVSALALMRLLQPGHSEVTAEALSFEGRDLLALDERAMAGLRGNRMAMIFQEPMTSLNPVFTVGRQIGETLRVHRGLSRAEARRRALEALRMVQVPAPERRLDAYPHQLSGGLRQRVMIAMALACDPALLIADAVAVMYAGRIVESAPAAALFRDAQHPYTLALLAALPSLSGPVERLEPIPGRMPAPGSAPFGCRFAPRCPFATAECQVPPPMRVLGPDHEVACWQAPVEARA
jgi:oligopeptide/dipeptide ABC transporter ATP-binding protein